MIHDCFKRSNYKKKLCQWQKQEHVDDFAFVRYTAFY
jgi:hypothetical protein